ncbi:MAG TPA: XrtA system polysaccharide deacetylase [Gemmatimonadaceae bacterium]|nr:XrtA system polysaccharide deacetylase [Gemmatimonadaceae bacterium]
MPTGATRPVAHFFTVDVEEHFQVEALEHAVPRTEWDRHPSRVERNVTMLLEILARHRVSATFFVLGWIASRHPALVRLIADGGHEVASHGYWHRRVSSMTLNDFRVDVRDAKAAIEDATGCAVQGFRAPGFSIVPGCEWAFDVLIEEGHEYDSSLFPVRRAGYGYPGSPRRPFVIDRPSGSLREYPMTTLDMWGMRLPAAGGGHLRRYPLGMTRRAFTESEERGASGVFYVPAWELDTEESRSAAGPLAWARRLGERANAPERIETLLGAFEFTSIARGAREEQELVA